MLLTEYLNSQFSLWQNLEFILRITVACVCGAFIGFERSKRYKEAGIRTHIIVCFAAALDSPGAPRPGPRLLFPRGKSNQKDAGPMVRTPSFICFLLTLRPDSLLFPMTSPGRWQTLRRRYSLALQSSSLASPPGSTLLLRDYRATGTVRAILPWCSHIP